MTSKFKKIQFMIFFISKTIAFGKKIFYLKFLDQNNANLAVARGVRLRVVTIATKIPGGLDQIIASLYLQSKK